MILLTGCVTNGRQVLLKEYGPSVPATADNGLKGRTICLKGFTSAADLFGFNPKSKAEEPMGFKYSEMAREHDKLWNSEMKALRKQTTKTDWKEIGNLRNGWGMVMSRVYALNDPADWLLQGLKYDLEALGARVVDSAKAADADVSVSGFIQLCRTDMYIMVNGTLVVDLEVQPKQGEARRKQIHTHGATAAMLASDGEHFHSLRDARQKFSILATREISEALKASAVKVSAKD